MHSKVEWPAESATSLALVDLHLDACREDVGAGAEDDAQQEEELPDEDFILSHDLLFPEVLLPIAGQTPTCLHLLVSTHSCYSLLPRATLLTHCCLHIHLMRTPTCTNTHTHTTQHNTTQHNTTQHNTTHTHTHTEIGIYTYLHVISRPRSTTLLREHACAA